MERLNKVINHLQDNCHQNFQTNYLDNDFSKCDNKSNFCFTIDETADKMFTYEQRQFYEENGYIVVRNLFNSEEVKYLYNRFEYLIANPEKAPRMIMMRDITQAKKIENPQKSKWTNNESNNNNTKNTGNIDEKFIVKLQMWSQEKGLWDNYASHEKLIEYIKAFLGSDVRAMHFMQINKPPDHGTLSSRHPLHQDQWYFPFGPSQFIVCSWTALQECDRNNGCLSVIPGTHRNHPGGKLLEHGYPQAWHGPVNKAYHGIQLTSDDSNDKDYKFNQLLRRRVHLEMKPGDTVFFHPLLLHASGANLTHQSRRSISVHYASSTRCDWTGFEHAKQKKIEQEVEGMAKAKAGVKVPFKLIWLMKSRHVCGKPGNLDQVDGIKSQAIP